MRAQTLTYSGVTLHDKCSRPYFLTFQILERIPLGEVLIYFSIHDV